MEKFIVGKKYQAVSVCDHNCIWTYTVKKRTEKTVWLQEEGKHAKKNVFSKKIKVFKNEEICFPHGHYSMAPILGACKQS